MATKTKDTEEVKMSLDRGSKDDYLDFLEKRGKEVNLGVSGGIPEDATDEEIGRKYIQLKNAKRDLEKLYNEVKKEVTERLQEREIVIGDEKLKATEVESSKVSYKKLSEKITDRFLNEEEKRRANKIKAGCTNKYTYYRIYRTNLKDE